jgi:hypothetical protein
MSRMRHCRRPVQDPGVARETAPLTHERDVMPTRPLPQGTQSVFGSRVILQRPQCAALIGAICAEWASAEASLAVYYAQLICGPISVRVSPYPGLIAALTAFDKLRSISTRIGMIKAAARGVELDHEIVETLGKKLKVLQNSGDSRIVAAHGRWGICDSLPDAVVWSEAIEFPTPLLVYDVPALEEMLEKICGATTDVFEFFQVSILPELETRAQDFITKIKAT